MTAERQAFPARTDAWLDVAAYVERRCRELYAGREATLRLLLVAEELFINTVTHGFRGDSTRRFHLVIRDRGAEIELVAEDGAGAFDPFAELPPVIASPDPAEHPVGGLGRALVAGISSRHAYERSGSRNRVTVGVRKTREAPLA